MEQEDLKSLDSIAQAIFDKKGANIIGLDVRHFSTMTDYYIVAEGAVNRHVTSLARNVVDVMQEQKQKALHIEGQIDGEWVVVDYGSIVVHLLTPEMREKYALEELWREAKLVHLNIDVNKPQVRGQNE